MQFQKTLPLISYPEFVQQVKTIDNFTSAQGRRYEVDGVLDDTLLFRRMDAGGAEWDSTCDRFIRPTANSNASKPKIFATMSNAGIRLPVVYCYASA